MRNLMLKLISLILVDENLSLSYCKSRGTTAATRLPATRLLPQEDVQLYKGLEDYFFNKHLEGLAPLITGPNMAQSSYRRPKSSPGMFSSLKDLSLPVTRSTPAS